MKSLALISYEWKIYIADRKAMGVILLAPFFLLLLFSYALSPLIEQETWIEKFDIALVNLDPSWETKTIVSHFESAEEVRQIVNIHHLNRAEAQKRLLANQIAAIIIIPEGFSKDLEVGANTPVEVIGNHQRPLQSELVRILMQSGADLITAAQSGVNTIYLYMQKANVNPVELEQVFNQSVMQFTLQSLVRGEIFEKRTVSAFGSITAEEYYAVSISILFLLGTGLLGLRIGQREGMIVLQRLLAVGIPFTKIILARWISLALLLAIPYTLYYTFIQFFLDDFFRGDWFSFLFISMLIIGTVSAFYLFLSSLVTQMANLNVLSFMFIMVMSIIGGSLIPLAYLPAWMDSLDVFSLNMWATRGLYDALFLGSGELLMHSAAVLGASTVLLLALSIWLGKRSTLPLR